MIISDRCQIYFKRQNNNSQITSTFVVQLYDQMFGCYKLMDVVAAQIYIILGHTLQKQSVCVALQVIYCTGQTHARYIVSASNVRLR